MGRKKAVKRNISDALSEIKVPNLRQTGKAGITRPQASCRAEGEQSAGVMEFQLPCTGLEMSFALLSGMALRVKSVNWESVLNGKILDLSLVCVPLRVCH